MADRRMFSKKIIDSDAFLDMPLTTQALYFHLSMRADDDGFVSNAKRIKTMIGASDDDLKLLIAKRFVLTFESGVVVIKHWRIHNYIQNDRYTPTTYVEEKATLSLDAKNAYTECIHDVSNLDTQDRVRLELELNNVSKNVDKNNTACARAREEIESYDDVLDSCGITDASLRRIVCEEIESYDDVLDSCGITDASLRRIVFEFIKHCQLNGRKVTNAKLYDIIVRLDLQTHCNAQQEYEILQRAIRKGYFDIPEA